MKTGKAVVHPTSPQQVVYLRKIFRLRRIPDGSMTFSPWEIELASRLVCFALCRAIWKSGDGPGSEKKHPQSCRRRLRFTGNGSEGEGEEMFGANRNEERACVGILGLLRLKTKMGYLKITRKNSSHVSNNLFVIQVSLVQAPTSR